MLDSGNHINCNNCKATGAAPGVTGQSLHQISSTAKTVAMPSRERFYVELKPGETTFVSWKKLLKEFHRTTLESSPPVEAPAGAHPALEARIAPEVVKDKDPLPPPPNRFNSVIERIERLYQGVDSDDEIVDSLDDDKYDTRDSFIDDTELDDYFNVEDAKLKHTGFFINRGRLEQETASPAVTLPKKRKRKDVKALDTESKVDELKPSKNSGKIKAAVKKTPPPSSGLDGNRKDSEILSRDVEKGADHAVAKTHTPKPSKDIVKEKGVGKPIQDVAVDSPVVDTLARVNNKEQSKLPGVTAESLERESKTLDYKDSPIVNGTKLKSFQRSAKDDDSRDGHGSIKKQPLASGKELSPMRSKGTTLDRAILDLEKGVAELCPPSSIPRDAEQGKRNRLPREIKLKLAKVARLAAKHGRITDELIERLMGILGHVMRVKTLKRNLKAMIEMGLSAMQEKEGRLQGIKKEVTEMIKSRVHDLQAQEVHLPENSQFVGTPTEKQGEGRYQWDHATEDKICDLYEQYIEGMDENKGPHLRKLYAELAELWPNGWMDNNGIRLAVHRAKERKKKLTKLNNSSDSKKRRRPVVKPKIEELGSSNEMTHYFISSASHDQSPTEKFNGAAEHEGYLSHGHERHQMEDKKHFKPFSSEKKLKTPEGSMPVKKKVKSQPEKGGPAVVTEFPFCSLSKGSTDDNLLGSTPNPTQQAPESPVWNIVTQQSMATKPSINE